jgi:predicted CXXCH cytochrome family protein
MSCSSLCCQNITSPPGKDAVLTDWLFPRLLRVAGTRSWLRKSRAAQGNAVHARASWISPGPETVSNCPAFEGIKAALGKSLLFLYLLLQCAFRGIGASEWHPGEMSCDSCHLAQEVNQTNSDQLVAEEAVLCQGCHQNAVDASHPIGVKPGFPLPAEFPLNARGEITCSTCHALHDPAKQRLRSGREGQSFCESCHEQSFFTQMTDGGISLMALGHLDAGEVFAGNIDGNAIGSESAKTNHPVGRLYADSIRFGGYRSSTRLPESILLPDGKLSCVSCHVGYSDSHGALVLENAAGNLCDACHEL